MTEHIIKLKSGLKIAYFDEGNSEHIILCIHGLGSNKKAFSKNIDYLSHYIRVIALDLPNYGNSSKGDYPSTLKFFSEIIKDFIQELKLDKVILCGHSMGGQIAILTALNFSDMVDKLILIAPAGLEKFNQDEIKRIERYFSFEAIKNMSKDQIEYNVKLNFYQFPDDAQFMINERIELSKSQNFDFYCLTVSRAFKDILRNPVIDFLPQINQPVLMFFGKNDELIPNKILHPITTENLARESCKKIKNCRLVLIDNCGHFLQFEKPIIFNQEVAEFVRN